MLKRLQIQNFLGFNALEINQLSGINLIAGKNNSGKTSLLEAVFLLSGGGNAQLAVNANVIRGIEKDGVSVRDFFWKQLFFNLDMEQSIKMVDLLWKSHRSNSPPLKLLLIVRTDLRRQTFLTNALSYSSIAILRIKQLKAIYVLRDKSSRFNSPL